MIGQAVRDLHSLYHTPDKELEISARSGIMLLYNEPSWTTKMRDNHDATCSMFRTLFDGFWKEGWIKEIVAKRAITGNLNDLFDECNYNNHPHYDIYKASKFVLVPVGNKKLWELRHTLWWSYLSFVTLIAHNGLCTRGIKQLSDEWELEKDGFRCRYNYNRFTELHNIVQTDLPEWDIYLDNFEIFHNEYKKTNNGK
jgi:hypothetical protein